MTYTCGIFLIDNRGKVLCCHITGRPRSGVGTWSIPKGLPDENESYPDAACRELMEETGLEIDVKKILPLKEVKYEKRSKTLVPFLSILKRSGDEIETKCYSFFETSTGSMCPEVDGFEWVDLDSAMLMLHESQSRCLDDVRLLLKKFMPDTL